MPLDRRAFLGTTAAGLLLGPSQLRGYFEPQITDGKSVRTEKGVVVAVSRPAAEAGRDVLRKGGNAVDAAIATALAMAVTYPAAGNIGGGGFMVIHPANGKPPVVIDYRETAPAAATRTMFVDEMSSHNHRVVGVPGTLRGLELAHSKFGKLAWKDLAESAFHLAQDGFAIDAAVAAQLNAILASSPAFMELQRVFSKPDGPWKAGDLLRQPDLAGTFKHISESGADALYKGPVGKLLVAEMEAGQGLITSQDLASYEAKAREPIHGQFRGFDIYGAPPPSSGGTCLIEMLNILEHFDLRKQGRWAVETLHLMTEAMRRAYLDRARFLGDPAFTTIPEKLIRKEYAKELADSISRDHATPSAELAADISLFPESDSTTHFSVIDAQGMAVSNTYTLEHSFGSRVVVRGAGFLLNNEMNDFNWKPGVTDSKGRIGTPANEVRPGKRMLSSQSPTIVTRGGKPYLIVGSPGGRTIINTVLSVVLNVLEFEMNLADAVAAPRQHHQWFPDVLRIEEGPQIEAALDPLRQLGHTVTLSQRQGDAHAILVDPKTGDRRGVADKRISGFAAAE